MASLYKIFKVRWGGENITKAVALIHDKCHELVFLKSHHFKTIYFSKQWQKKSKKSNVLSISFPGYTWTGMAVSLYFLKKG